MAPRTKGLRINPLRRRESERMKARSASGATTPTSARSLSSAGDTIEVAQKSSDDPGESVPAAFAESTLEAEASEQLPAKVAEHPMELVDQAAELMEKQAANDLQTADVDDAVTEYDFTNDKDSAYDDEEDENPRGIFTDLDHEIIEISSDDGMPQNSFALDSRPWRNMTEAQRAEYEKMYCEQLARAIEGDWQSSENYQEMQDMEMEEYIKDIKLQDWVIGVRNAQRAWDQMIARKKMRGFGVPVYQEQILRQLGIQPRPPLQHLPAPAHTRNQAPRQPRPPPKPHHTASQQMAPQNGMPPGTEPQASPTGAMPPHIVYQAMQQVGVDQNGQPVYQPVHPAPHHAQPSPSPLNSQLMGPPAAPAKRKQSHPHAPQWVGPVSAQEPMMLDGAEHNNKRRKRDSHQKRDSQGMAVTATAPVDAILVRPYSTHQEPSDGPAPATKKSKSGTVKNPEPDVFPWNRKIDFPAAKANARWDDTIYTPATVQAMQTVRDRNASKVDRIDAEDNEKYRQAKILRAPDEEKPKRQKRGMELVEASESSSYALSDLQSFGQFGYATEADHHKAMALVKSPAGSALGVSDEFSVEDLMEAANAGGIDINMLNGIMICWRSSKKGLTQALQLQQVVFSVRDSILTRRQLAQTPVLTDRAAQCLIDFCPDTLWRDVLLRITSETSIGPLKVRDRMCQNGNYVDRSSITKRIGAALGKKQSRAKGDKEAAAAAYMQNKEDYTKYQAFFGNVFAVRKSAAGQLGKGKRNATDDVYMSGAESRSASSGSGGSVVEVKEGGRERMTTRSSSGKGKGKAKMIQLDGAVDDDNDFKEAMESRPGSSGSEGGVVVGERWMKTRSLSSTKGKGKAMLDVEDDEDEDGEQGVKLGGKPVDPDEVSLQSDGELDCLVNDSD